VKVGPEFAIDAHEEVERNAYNSAIAMHLVKRRSARKSSEPAKPGQQVIILPPEAAPFESSGRSLEAGEAPQVRQCASHDGQAVSEHLENPVPLAADLERRLFDAASLETP
jgi:hypothetical protein